MNEHFQKSPEHNNENNENINISDSLSRLEKEFSEQYKVSLEWLKFLQELFKKKSTLEIWELKFDIELSSLNEIDKGYLSKIPDQLLENFITEVCIYKETVSAEIKKLNNDIIWEQHSDFISSQKPLWISDARFARANNPSKPHHHIDWCVVWIRQTVNTTAKFTWELIVDTIKFPYHVWQLWTWKANLPDYQA